MRSFSFLPSRLILVPSALQSHALVPFRPTSSSSAPPVTYPFTIPSHIIPVSPSSHTPFYLSVPHHPRQPSSHTPFYLSVSRHPRQSSSHIPFYLFVPHHPRQPLHFHALLPFRPTSSPSVLQSHTLLPFHFIQHFVPHLRFFSPCPRPSGKVPGISAKTVHFPPRPAGALAP